MSMFYVSPLGYIREEDPCFKFSQKGSLRCEVAVALLAIGSLAVLIACKFGKPGKLDHTAFIALAGTMGAIPLLVLLKRGVPKAYVAFREDLRNKYVKARLTNYGIPLQDIQRNHTDIPPPDDPETIVDPS